MTGKPFIADAVVPGRRCGQVVAVVGNKYRLVDDEGRVFRGEAARESRRYFRVGDRLIVFSGVVVGPDRQGRENV